jgi:hypothetical protein
MTGLKSGRDFLSGKRERRRSPQEIKEECPKEPTHRPRRNICTGLVVLNTDDARFSYGGSFTPKRSTLQMGGRTLKLSEKVFKNHSKTKSEKRQAEMEALRKENAVPSYKMEALLERMLNYQQEAEVKEMVKAETVVKAQAEEKVKEKVKVKAEADVKVAVEPKPEPELELEPEQEQEQEQEEVKAGAEVGEPKQEKRMKRNGDGSLRLRPKKLGAKWDPGPPRGGCNPKRRRQRQQKRTQTTKLKIMLREYRLNKAGFDKWNKLQVQVAIVRLICNHGVNKEFYSDVVKARINFKRSLDQTKSQPVIQHIRRLGEFKVLHRRKVAQLEPYLEQATSLRSFVLNSGAMVKSVDGNKAALATSEKVEEVTPVSGVKTKKVVEHQTNSEMVVEHQRSGDKLYLIKVFMKQIAVRGVKTKKVAEHPTNSEKFVEHKRGGGKLYLFKVFKKQIAVPGVTTRKVAEHQTNSEKVVEHQRSGDKLYLIKVLMKQIAVPGVTTRKVAEHQTNSEKVVEHQRSGDKLYLIKVLMKQIAVPGVKTKGGKLARRLAKKDNKKVRQYKVKWAGNYPTEWLHFARVKAQKLNLEWETKKLAKGFYYQLGSTKCYQLNAGVEMVPAVTKEKEENPFKKLFDIKTRQRLPLPLKKV